MVRSILVAFFLLAGPGDCAAKDRVLVIPYHQATILGGLEVPQEILDYCAPTLDLPAVLRGMWKIGGKRYQAVSTEVPKDGTPYHLLKLEAGTRRSQGGMFA